MATSGEPDEEKMSQEKLRNEIMKGVSDAERFRRYKRSLELTIHNNTKGATFKFEEQHFGSGTWFESFTSSVVAPGEFSKALVANRTGAIAGVAGGLRFSIESKGKEKCYLIIGFKNPFVGSYKTYISVEEKPKDAKSGTKNAKTDHHKLFTVYQGYEVEAKLTTPAAGGNKHFLFTISDLPL